MRTAEEMYQYCLKTGTVGLLDYGARKHIEALGKALSAGEEVLICFVGWAVYGSSTRSEQRAYALTNQRVLSACNGAKGQSIQAIGLDSVDGISVNTGAIKGSISIYGVSSVLRIEVSHYSAVLLDAIIRDALFMAKQVQGQHYARQESYDGGIADDLVKLKQLLDTGAITQDEFESAKRRILS